METVQKILNCERCKDYSIKITGSTYNETVSKAIFKIINAEYNGTVIKDYYQYYKRSLWIANISISRYEAKRLWLEDTEVQQEEVSLNSEYQNESLALSNFLNKEFTKQSDKFLQDLINLSLELTKTEICDMLEWHRGELNKYLKIAYKRIKDEYIRIDNNI